MPDQPAQNSQQRDHSETEAQRLARRRQERGALLRQRYQARLAKLEPTCRLARIPRQT